MAVWQRFTDRARRIVVLAQEEAHQAGAAEVGPEHLLLGVVREADSAAMKILEKNGVSPRRVRTGLAKQVPPSKKGEVVSEPGEKNLSERAKRALQQAYNEARAMNHNYVGTEHLLLGLLSGDEKDPAAQTLRSFGLQLAAVREEVIAVVSQQPSLPTVSPKPGATSILDEMGKNLAVSAQERPWGPLVGREEIVEQVEMILLRRRRRGACLVGPPGVGKMAIIREIQTRILQRKVPESLQGYHLIVLDGARLAGTIGKSNGLEDPFWKLLHEAMFSPITLLVIEHLHLLFGEQSTERTRQVARTLLLTLVEQGLPCLGTCPPEEYDRLAADVSGFVDVFRAVRVPEPTPELTQEILQTVRSVYEAYHGVRLPDALLDKIVALAQARITTRYFPGKAIHLLDDAAARARQKAYANLPEETRALLHQLVAVRFQQEEAVTQQNFEEAARHRDEVRRLEKELAAASSSSEPVEVTEEDLRDVVRMGSGGSGWEEESAAN